MAHSKKYVRATFTSLVLVLSALCAHAINANFALNPNKLLIQFFVIIALASIFSKREFFGPKLALLVTVIQSTTHFVLGGSSNSGSQMLLTHIFFGFAAFYVITYFENIWNRISDAFQILNFKTVNLCLNFSKIEILKTQSFQSANSFALNRYRGPPLANSEVF